MATKKAGGSSRNGRDSNPQYRGVKVYAGQTVTAGSILIRQVGKTYGNGTFVGCGKDYTLYALASGVVYYYRSKGKTFVDVKPLEKSVSS